MVHNGFIHKEMLHDKSSNGFDFVQGKKYGFHFDLPQHGSSL